MKHNDLSGNPKLSRLSFEIEKVIFDNDRSSRGNLNDADAQSGLRRTLSLCKGRQLIEPGNESDRQRAALALDLGLLYRKVLEDEDISKHDFIIALLAVEDSLKSRGVHHGHERGYLDNLAETMADFSADQEAA